MSNIISSTTVLYLQFLLFLVAACSTNASRMRLNSTTNNRSQKVSLSLALDVTDTHVVMENGHIKVTLTNPTGSIAGIEYDEIDNVLEDTKKETDRAEWDIIWSTTKRKNKYDLLFASEFKVIVNDENQIELSFTKSFSSDDDSSAPLIVDKRYVLLPGHSGFYTYAIFNHPQGWADVDISEARIAFNLRKSMFSYMAISNNLQRVMPTVDDRRTGEKLAFKEAALLTNPSNTSLKGEVDDKYQYSLENKDLKVHGWICQKPHVGFWIIKGSSEFLSGGPIKQDLTSHVGPTSLMVFVSDHYIGEDFTLSLRNGESWKKVLGPVYIYLNSDSTNNPSTLWRDAENMANVENRKWPYDFPKSHSYPNRDFRGTLTGRLLVRDRFLGTGFIDAECAHIGLAPPGDAGSWQREVKGYQFWTESNNQGHFTIDAVRPGVYNLYAWVPGILGDYKYNKRIVIKPGDKIDVNDLVFEPPRNGPTLWEIGIPDRKASEFYIPDPDPALVNRLFLIHKDQKFRQYGLWDRYTYYYPEHDLVYMVGQSDYQKDWFFAHVNRLGRNHSYESTTWKIIFRLDNVSRGEMYTLRIALASSSYANILVWINNQQGRPNFVINGLWRDNAIARHGIHGQYSEHNYNFRGDKLVNGENTIYMEQSRGKSPFSGVMYDYIRLEGPQQN
ncbi:hypothetical protein DM860_009614 [Cuscuta australis]|uniref:rhamnogalacturonan endolyase n=1 Tax=Cuscuta australis TaxID=267555 RepID=A0A328DKG1_9ASTE|nr:hypothetical protein DM860_009614 [Cuscuta australis]